MITFDPKKDAINRAKHGIALSQFARMDLETATATERHVNNEVREVIAGLIDQRLYIAVTTMRDGTIRVISLRKANVREQKRYEKTRSST